MRVEWLTNHRQALDTTAVDFAMLPHGFTYFVSGVLRALEVRKNTVECSQNSVFSRNVEMICYTISNYFDLT